MLIFLLFTLLACDESGKVNTSEQTLTFSTDTLSFDTVFTTIGSATSKLMVYNKRNKPLTINSIELSGKSSSAFRINVDGLNDINHSFGEMTLRARDSMFIFVEVTVNPNDVNSPVLVQDSLIFTLENKQQKVILEAVGQDVEILRGLVIERDTILQSDKPFLVFDSLIVRENATLSIYEGSSLFFHYNTGLWVFGNLEVNGTFEKPVLMRADRLDKALSSDPFPYNLLPGQWGGIYLFSKTGRHIINHLHLNSGVQGIYFSNNDLNSNPYLEINNSKIHNSLVYGLVAVNGDLRVTNSEITNSGSYTVYLNGGKHEFYHCTIANHFSENDVNWLISAGRDSAPAVMVMDLNKAQAMETIFKNCIISGTSSYEFTLASKFRHKFNADIQHTYIKRLKPDSLQVFQHIRWYELNDTVFVSSLNNIKKQIYFNFTPDSVSPARGLADPEISTLFPLDLNGKSRLADGEPDAGAYEWYPKTEE